MSGNFTNLLLDEGLILGAIKDFFENKSELNAHVADNFVNINVPSGQKRCVVSIDKEKFFLDIYCKKDGKLL